MSLPPLNVKIGADTSGLDAGLNRSQQVMRRFALGIAGAAAAAGTAMLAMTQRAMQNADELAKSARQIGLTTDRLQAMQLVAREAGIGTQSLTNSLGIMQRNIVELERGTSGQVRAFESLGISIKDLQGLNADQQFERIAASLNNVEDPAQRTALAMEIFGRSGREVINMLDGYSDKLADATEFQRRFGIAIEQTDAEAIERANDAVGRLREAFGGLGNLLAVRFAPAIERTSNLLLGLAGHIADRVNPPTDTLLGLIGDLPGKMDGAAAAEPGLSAALGNLGEAANSTAKELSLVAGWLDEIAKKWSENQALGAPQTMFSGQSRFGGIAPPDGDGTGLGDFLANPPPINPGRPDVRTPGSDTVRPRAAPPMLGEPLAVPSIGGGGAVRDQFARRLEALQAGLQTEAEVIDGWYQESLAILDEGLERKLITEEEYLEARARLEEEYARRSNQIERMRQQNNFQEATKGMGQILDAVGQGNEKAMRMARAFNAGMAWIDTLAGAARELRKGTFGFATAAAVIAKGVGFVNAINNTSTRSRGAIGGGVAGGAGAAAQAPAPPTQTVIIDAPAGMGMQEMVNMLNEAHKRGYLLRFETA